MKTGKLDFLLCEMLKLSNWLILLALFLQSRVSALQMSLFPKIKGTSKSFCYPFVAQILSPNSGYGRKRKKTTAPTVRLSTSTQISMLCLLHEKPGFIFVLDVSVNLHIIFWLQPWNFVDSIFLFCQIQTKNIRIFSLTPLHLWFQHGLGSNFLLEQRRLDFPA